MPRSPSNPRARLIDRPLLKRWPLPQPARQGDKEARGKVLVVGGARQMPGPMILAATAALRAGAGKLQIATVASVAPVVGAVVPEALVHGVAEGDDGSFARQTAPEVIAAARGARAILIGPGMLENQTLGDLVLEILRALDERQTVVLDAGAMTIFGGRLPELAALQLRCPLVLTPHAGEMATLIGQDKDRVVADQAAVAVAAARTLGAVIVHKGAETVVTDGKVSFINRAGNVGLATSGSGDVLAGLIAGLAARGASPLQAAAWGVHLHACAGDRLSRVHGPMGYLARELGAEVPRLMAAYGAVRRSRAS